MSICSYLVLARPGTRDDLAGRLQAWPGCEVLPAENRDVLIVVAETASTGNDDGLEARLWAEDDVTGVSLVAGFADV
jgi:nitrate reductase NapAB chaperone NapD